MLQNTWNPTLYEGKHAFVWKYGEDLLNLLFPQPGEKILDVGCGTGQLAAKIAANGTIVTGIDASAAMVEKAKLNYPNLEFVVADARSFQFNTSFDAVFSNATLHWIPEPEAVINSIYRALKPGGRFIAEFGGKGGIKLITDALYQAIEIKSSQSWYFPSIGEYATMLEQQGFDVIYAVLFDRPTPLEHAAGMANWIQMFASRFLTGLSEEEQTQVIQAIEDRLKPTLYHDGKWWADYRRIRVVAHRRV